MYIWNSAKEAADSIGISASIISNARAGRVKSADGYKWKYEA